jgi:hypothetical protein
MFLPKPSEPSLAGSYTKTHVKLTCIGQVHGFVGLSAWLHLVDAQNLRSSIVIATSLVWQPTTGKTELGILLAL